jgi:hypothetical protein
MRKNTWIFLVGLTGFIGSEASAMEPALLRGSEVGFALFGGDGGCVRPKKTFLACPVGPRGRRMTGGGSRGLGPVEF